MVDVRTGNLFHLTVTFVNPCSRQVTTPGLGTFGILESGNTRTRNKSQGLSKPGAVEAVFCLSVGKRTWAFLDNGVSQSPNLGQTQITREWAKSEVAINTSFKHLIKIKSSR